MKVFDKEGNEHDKLSVDARECVATLGWTLNKEEPKEDGVDDEFTKMTNNKMKDYLFAVGVTAPANANKELLLSLCREAKGQAE